MNKLKLNLRGMHCKSCEILVEDNLKEIKGVAEARADYRKGELEITHQGESLDLTLIREAVKKAGYSLGEKEKIGFFSAKKEDYQDLGVAFLFLAGIYFISQSFGLFNFNLGAASEKLTLSMILLIGLTAGFSTCMALVGGLIIGLSAKHNRAHSQATPLEKFRPHLFFNFGRIVGYIFLGGLLGLAGLVLQLSSATLGILTIFIGLVMLVLGFQLIEIFPWVNNLQLTLPKGLAKIFGLGKKDREYSHINSFVLGALSFFLPCGFTQAMQVYAIGTGNFFAGAAVMGLFAIGTMPGLLGIGGLVSAVKGTLARRFFKFAGLVVIVFALFNINNGLGLAGWNFAYDQKRETVASDPNVSVENGVQIVRMAETNRGYEPNAFTIKKDLPVRWIIDAQAPYSCAASLVVPKLNIRKNLQAGENTIEFTPTEEGKLKFSCTMGMYTGVFNVVDDEGSIPITNETDSQPEVLSAGGCSGCSGEVAGGCSKSSGSVGGCGCAKSGSSANCH